MRQSKTCMKRFMVCCAYGCVGAYQLARFCLPKFAALHVGEPLNREFEIRESRGLAQEQALSAAIARRRPLGHQQTKTTPSNSTLTWLKCFLYFWQFRKP